MNMAGREPNGIVTEADYETRRQEVIDALRTLADENGRSLITKIILHEDVYHGPYAKYGPDIQLIIDDYNMIAFPMFATDGNIITQQIRGDSGCHRREGIFIACAPGIKQGETLSAANILDLAPTIMAMLGEPVPAIMDGQALTDLFAVPPAVTFDDREWTAVQQTQTLALEEEAQVEERLRSLGYL